ncbi:MAG: glycosyltransferase family 4 protein [Candidatus Omnitrophica bacterium]|nr:glycosyltransferase family 4 protein [Candidatus Omnitrophota bacterium]
MKILIIANGIIGKNPGLSGGDVRFLEIAKYWAKSGQEIHLLSSQSAEKICANFGLKAILHIILGTEKTEKRSSFILRTLQTMFFLPESLNSFREGIVYSVNDSLFDVIPALRLKLRNRDKIKWAAVVHWLPPFPPWKRKKTTLSNSTLFFINERISVWLANRFADILLPVSKMTALQLQEAGMNMKKVHPVKCGVNFKEIRRIVADVKEKKYDAVFMKRVQPVKGIFDLIDIWKRVVKQKENAKLLIIGDVGDEEGKIEAVIKKENLEDNIEFAGYIFDVKEKFRRLAESRLFVLPSYEENWAIAVGEAMAAGIPIIAYDLKELINIWKNHVVWIPLGETQAFARRILEYLDNQLILKGLLEEDVEFIKSLEWENIAKEELEVILRK